jgi:hypothetical protein
VGLWATRDAKSQERTVKFKRNLQHRKLAARLSQRDKPSLTAVMLEFCYKYVDINKRHRGVASSIDGYRKEKDI